MGLLDLARIESTVDLPPEVVRLLTDYLNGKTGTLELATRLETLRPRPPVLVP